MYPLVLGRTCHSGRRRCAAQHLRGRTAAYTGSMNDEEPTRAPVAALLENQRAFLRYLERRVGDRALAEDILQDAFVKTLARPD